MVMVIDSAAQAKVLLARKLMLVSGHQIVASEISEFNNPDILSLTKSENLIEYEIKISRADLMGELNSVKKCKHMILTRNMNRHNQQINMLGGNKVHIRGNVFVDEEAEAEYEKIGKCSKLDKHERYLIAKPSTQGAYGYFEQPYRPNQFYFAVTADLVDLAMQVCEGLPYGVIDLNGLNGSSSVKKKAGFIHRDVPSRYDIWRMARSLSFGYWDSRAIISARQNNLGE